MTFFSPLAGTCFAGKEIFFCFVLGGVGDLAASRRIFHYFYSILYDHQKHATIHQKNASFWLQR